MDVHFYFKIYLYYSVYAIIISYISIIQHHLHGFVEYCLDKMTYFSSAGIKFSGFLFSLSGLLLKRFQSIHELLRHFPQKL